MNFEEHAAKPLLRAAGIATPEGVLAASADEAGRRQPTSDRASSRPRCRPASAARQAASSSRIAAEAKTAASAIFGMSIGEHRVERLLVEAQVPIAREMYAAVLNDPASKGPLLLFSTRRRHGYRGDCGHASRCPGAPAHRHSHRARSPRHWKRALPADLPCDRDSTWSMPCCRLYAVYAATTPSWWRSIRWS